MALAEGAALRVLAGQANRGAVGEDRGEGQRFGVRPVDLASGVSSSRARRSHCRGELRSEREAVREGVNRGVDSRAA